MKRGNRFGNPTAALCQGCSQINPLTRDVYNIQRLSIPTIVTNLDLGSTMRSRSGDYSGFKGWPRIICCVRTWDVAAYYPVLAESVPPSGLCIPQPSTACRRRAQINGEMERGTHHSNTHFMGANFYTGSSDQTRKLNWLFSIFPCFNHTNFGFRLDPSSL